MQNLTEILKELERAKEVHPHFSSSLANQLHIVGEEFGETIQAYNKWNDDKTGSKEHIKEELIQLGAMVLRTLENWVDEEE